MRGQAHFRLRETGTTVAAGVRAHSLSIAIDLDKVYTFDRAGRLLGFFDAGTYYKRGLDHRIICKERQSSHPPGVVEVGGKDSPRIYEDIFAPLFRIAGELRRNRVVWTDEVDLPQRRRLALAVFATVIAMAPDQLAVDAGKFGRVYSPVAILPPDQYLALVLQLTEGCTYNQCRFCHFYRDRPFKVKSPAEFRGHIDDVVAYFGPGISVRQSIFLADANALVVDPAKLEPLLQIVRERFYDSGGVKNFRPRGIYSFVDTFHTEFDNTDVWRRYAQLGVRRVYLGVESGCDELLAAMDKPATAAATQHAVRVLKTSGINVGVIIMTGLGGRPYAKRHVADTTDLLNRLPLGHGDLIYFSPYVETGSREEMSEFQPELTERQCHTQRDTIRKGLHLNSPGPKLATYSLREFVY